MEHNLITKQSSKEFQGPLEQTAAAQNGRYRAVEEKQWVQALLWICGRKMHPGYLRRWLRKYRDDCRLVQYGASRLRA